MPVVPGLCGVANAGRSYYRITSLAFRTTGAVHHRKVVNGEGAVKSRHGARYNHPGARTVYLAEDVHVCLAERMFYFHREVLTGMDCSHLTGFFPPLVQRSILWDVGLKQDVTHLFELNATNATAMNVYPSLVLNPSQDYHHLKDRRAAIEHQGYRGLRAPSARVRGSGNMVVLFEDQSRNVSRITPYEVELRLMTTDTPPHPFTNHAADLLEYQAGEVRILAPGGGVPLPAELGLFQDWTRVEFNH